MQSNFITYLKILFAITGFCLIVVAVTNRIIDPYNEFGKNWTGIYFQTERQQKNFIKEFPHDAIILGSSRTSHIDPDDICMYKFYNASLSSELPEEMYYYLKKYLNDEKMVAIGFDFFMFNESLYPLKDMDQWPQHEWPIDQYLFGLNVFKDSLTAFLNWRKHAPQHLVANGYSPYPDDNGPLNTSFYNNEINYLYNYHYVKYKFSPERLKYMQQLKALLQEHHAAYLTFINPIQEDDLALLKRSGRYEAFLHWKEQLKAVFPDLKDFSESKYTAKKYFHTNDPSHYLTSTGDEILNGLLGCGQ